MAVWDGLGPNQWMTANCTPTEQWPVAVGPNFVSSDNPTGIVYFEPRVRPDPVSRTYSGLVVCGRKVAWPACGGHSSHPGNGTPIYDPDQNAWLPSYQDEAPPYDAAQTSDYGRICGTGGHSHNMSPLGRPWTEHTYQYQAWDGSRGRILALRGGRLWSFNLGTLDWNLLQGLGVPPTGAPDPGTSHGLLMIDPAGDAALVFTTQGGHNMQARDVWRTPLETISWQRQPSLPNGPWIGTNIWGCYDSDRHVFYIYLWYQGAAALLEYNPQAQTTLLVMDNTTAPSWWARNNPLFDYDQLARKVLWLEAPTPTTPYGLHAWDPLSGLWTDIPAPVGAPGNPGISGGAERGTFRYIPQANVWMFLQFTGSLYCANTGGGSCGGFSKTWFYRYTLGGDMVPPPIPRAPRLIGATQS